jgi:hypothetical protein
LDWTDKSWNTEVAELGIACGACHGPAGEHAQRAISPVTRYRWHVKDPGAPPVAVTTRPDWIPIAPQWCADIVMDNGFRSHAIEFTQ